MKRIKLTNYKYTRVDDEDFNRVNQYRWFAMETRPGHFYAATYILGHRVYLHKFLTNTDKHTLVDHKDNRGLNNQRYNLRVVTVSQNGLNSKLSAANTSGFKNVSFDSLVKKWRIRFSVDGESIYSHFFKYKKHAVYRSKIFRKVLSITTNGELFPIDNSLLKTGENKKYYDMIPLLSSIKRKLSEL